MFSRRRRHSKNLLNSIFLLRSPRIRHGPSKNVSLSSSHTFSSNACARSVTFLGIANAFAGGIFLAISPMHILPEAIEAYEKYYEPVPEYDSDGYRLRHEEHGWETFPYLMYFVGYFIILMVDKVIFDTHSLAGDHGHGGEHGHGHDH